VRCELELLVLFSLTYSSPHKPKHEAGFGTCTDSVNRQKKRKRTRNFDHYVRGKKWDVAAENCVMGSIVIVNAHQISGDKMKKNEIGGACGLCGR
jgi:hypothetical protein